MFYFSPGISLKTDRLTNSLCIGVKFIPINHPKPRWLSTYENIFTDRHVWNKRKFLMNDGNASILAVTNVAKFLSLARDKNLSCILVTPVEAGQNFHQSGFAGAVFAT